MARFRVQGAKPLRGELALQGAKNEAYQAICATLLTSEPVTLHNVPDILDIQQVIRLLQLIGVQVERLGKNSYRFIAAALDSDALQQEEFQYNAGKIRGSSMLLGPLLARLGQAQIPHPGGDKIGRRPLDAHLLGLQKLGAHCHFDVRTTTYTAEAKQLKGAYILMTEASVTGTANLLMAAVMAKGTTTLYNAACEPYIQNLCLMLIQMGARIEGIGSNLLTIHGVDMLYGTEHTIMPDILELGSFIGLAAMTMSDLTIKNVPTSHSTGILDTFAQLGVITHLEGNELHVPAQPRYNISKMFDGSILTIADGTWPRFAPDLLSIALVTAIQAKGTVLIHQRMYESRLFFVDKLIDMGAQVILCDPHRAVVIGLDRQYPLRGIQVSSPDIRAGLALLIAALSAEGTSIIDHVEQIDRGYESIDERLRSLGASIERIDS